MGWKVEAKKLWAQKWWVLAFCVIVFIFADHAVIHSSECYDSPCFEFPTLVVQGMSFVAPTGLLSANIMMPVNYVDRYTEGIYFRGGFFYQAATRAVVEDDLDPTEKPQVTKEDSDFFLSSTFLVHKLRVLFSFPLWIWFYWLLFVRLRGIIKRKTAYRVVVSLIMATFLLLGFFLKIEIGGGTDLTWHYILNFPEPKTVDYAG